MRDLPLSRSHYNVAHNGRTIRAQTRPTATATSSRRVRAEPEVDFQTAAAIGLRGLECHAALLSTLTPRQVFDLLGWVEVSKLKRQGVLRMVRDVFHVCGFVELGGEDAINRIVLNGAAAWARRCANFLLALLKQAHVCVALSET